MGSHGEQRGSEMARGSREHMCVREEKVVAQVRLDPKYDFQSSRGLLERKKESGNGVRATCESGVELHGRKNRNKTLTTQLTVTDRGKGKRCFLKQKVLQASMLVSCNPPSYT